MNKNRENLKVVISCGSYSWGGLEMVALQNAVKLREKDCIIKIIAAVNSRFRSEAFAAGLEVTSVFSKGWGVFSSISKLKKLVREFNPDVIHTHLSHDLGVITPALKSAKSDAKLYLTKHMASGVKKTDIFHKYLYSRLSGIFSVSNYINESVIKTCPVPPDKIHILPNGIDLNDYDSYRLQVMRIIFQKYWGQLIYLRFPLIMNHSA
jgi:glycosyltransferase involved in cell wall biosynthesis